VAVVPRTHAQAVVEAMRAHPAGRDAALVGEVAAAPRAIAVLRTVLGGERMLDMLVGEQLPRIC
jgi:hydrogenase expression/formation protein HypE